MLTYLYSSSSNPEHHHKVVLQQKLVHEVRVSFTLPAIGYWIGKVSGLLFSFLDALQQEWRWIIGPLLPAVQLSCQFIHEIGLC